MLNTWPDKNIDCYNMYRLPQRTLAQWINNHHAAMQDWYHQWWCWLKLLTLNMLIAILFHHSECGNKIITTHVYPDVLNVKCFDILYSTTTRWKGRIGLIDVSMSDSLMLENHRLNLYHYLVSTSPLRLVWVLWIHTVTVIKPRHCFAWRGFLLCVCLSVCVCVSVTKISKKILNRSTSFLAGAFPLIQGGNHSILKKIALG